MLTISPTGRLFVLTGAGVSAESGIPTFRGVNGLWRNYRIEEVASPDAWRHDPRLACGAASSVGGGGGTRSRPLALRSLLPKLDRGPK
jgi:NAD-dependent SIR2 family protein deacetylase